MLRAARTLTILLVGACTATVQGQPGSPPAAPPNVVPGASAPPPPTPNKYVPPEKIDGETLDQWILKLDNRDPQVRELAHTVRLSLASSHPGEPLWAHLAARLRSPVNNPG